MKKDKPFSTIFINKKYRFLICSIEKSACTSTRQWLLSMEPSTKSHIHDNFKCNINQNIYRCSRFNLHKINDEFPILSKTLRNFPSIDKFIKQKYYNRYYKIVFVRNPWSRLVSAYLSKFCISTINKLKAAQIAAEYIYNKYNMDRDKMLNYNEPGGITFSQFVEYLNDSKNLRKMDLHWRPQYLFLTDFKYDFIGKIENQKSNIDFLKKKLNITEDYPHLTSHNYCEEDIESYNLMPYELNKIKKQFGGYPKWEKFYNKELAKLVGNLYKEDIEMLGYEFELAK